MKINVIFPGFLIGILIALLTACGPEERISEQTYSLLRVGVLPDQHKDKLIKKYQPLFDFLSKETGIPVEFIPSDNYADLLSQIRNGRLDLFFLGGVTFVQAYVEKAVQPLVMRNIDTRFTSYFLVRADHPAKDLKETRTQVLGFGSKFSTSGHYMPRYYLEQKSIVPEYFFKEIRYSGKHDLTALWVQNGKVDVGVANSNIVDAMLKSGELDKNKIRVLWETPPYSDYVWAVNNQMPQALQTKVINAFLDLSLDQPDHRTILEFLGAEYFLPANASEFQNLIRIYRSVHIPRKETQ
ncbi:phosphate/phosphite/phosphonate ABC transporter substrate-binding protein [Candidatus Saccharibacteria bacterium]|nr:phosphate/phosphite/phosphonate ABC transporter substrate-binding protein [Candidatus Saccharibacteria bacterium]NIW78003.1 phosphate/phosphite/phosphonate ABC transporter substrate-binding protein [Calditrichia bacterium]